MESVACWLCQDFVSICAAIRQRDIKVNWNACRSTQHQLASWLSRVEHLKLNLKLERCCTGVAAAARGPCHARADGRVSKIFNWICHWAAAIVWAMVGVGVWAWVYTVATHCVTVSCTPFPSRYWRPPPWAECRLQFWQTSWCAGPSPWHAMRAGCGAICRSEMETSVGILKLDTDKTRPRHFNLQTAIINWGLKTGKKKKK